MSTTQLIVRAVAGIALCAIGLYGIHRGVSGSGWVVAVGAIVALHI